MKKQELHKKSFFAEEIQAALQSQSKPSVKAVEQLKAFATYFSTPRHLIDTFGLSKKFCQNCQKFNSHIQFDQCDTIDVEGKNDEQTFEILLKTFEEMITTNKLSEEQKEVIYADVLSVFAECSCDEDFCQNKICVVVQHIGGADVDDLVEEYDSIEEAEKDVEDRYIGCLDDAYFAETVWFELLCNIRENEYDNTYNYCTIFAFDAIDIEDGREDWETENCVLENDEE